MSIPSDCLQKLRGGGQKTKVAILHQLSTNLLKRQIESYNFTLKLFDYLMGQVGIAKSIIIKNNGCILSNKFIWQPNIFRKERLKAIISGDNY